MLSEFFSSWSLFHNSYLVGWLVALLLAEVGVLVVARDQIFIGASVSQASALGIAMGLVAGSWPVAQRFAWMQSDTFLSAMAVIFSVLAARITERGGGPGRESHEAITGWVYLFSGSLAILLVSHSPHGLDEIQRLLSSSIIGATPKDVALFATLLGLTSLTLVFLWRRLLLYMVDPLMATAVGMKLNRWSAASSLWLGLAVGLSIRVSGMLYTFGCLVLPALIAKNLSREVRPLFFMAPLIAFAAAFASFVLANHFDFPPGQMTVGLLAVFLTLAWAKHHWIRK